MFLFSLIHLTQYRKHPFGTLSPSRQGVNLAFTAFVPFFRENIKYMFLALIIVFFFLYLFQNAHTHLGNHCTDFFTCKAAHFCGTKRCNPMCMKVQLSFCAMYRGSLKRLYRKSDYPECIKQICKTRNFCEIIRDNILM